MTRTLLNTRYDYADFQKTVRALKTIRLEKGLNRREAAEKIGWTMRSIEQLENGRCNFSRARLQKVLLAYEVSEGEFEQIRKQPKLALARSCERGEADRTVGRKPRRNHLKIVTKEVRVLRAFRKRKGLSQYAASKLCGFAPSMFGHIEEGRIELRPDRIVHILKCLELTVKDFDELVHSPLLRDEILEEVSRLVHKLDDSALVSAMNIIKALIK